MSRQILAIDIRNKTLAAVLLNAGLKNNTVAGCIQMPLNGASEDTDLLADTLESLITELNLGSANVVVSLPADETIFRILTVPFKEEGKIKQVLPFELEPIVPVPVDDLIIGFQKEVIAEQTEVLTTAMDRQRYEGFVQSFSAANLKPQLIVPGSFPIVSQVLLHDAHLPEQILILDVDHHKTILYALASGRIALVRSLIGSMETEAQVEALALQIRQTLTAFEDISSNVYQPASVIICGPGLQKPSMADRLSEALDLPVNPLDLRHRLGNVEFVDTDTYESWHMDNALALALLEAEGLHCPSFHRTSSPLRNYWAAYQPYIKTPVILLVLVMILGLGSVFYDNHILQQRLDRIDNRLEELFKSTFPNEPLAKGAALAQMKSKLKEARKGSSAPIQGASRMRSIDTLLQISRLVPDSIDVIINRFVVGDETVTISGETSGFNIVDDIKNRLEKSEFFSEVDIASANMDKAGKKVRFKLKIEYEEN
jgi:type II secretory pathway component PulL